MGVAAKRARSGKNACFHKKWAPDAAFVKQTLAPSERARPTMKQTLNTKHRARHCYRKRASCGINSSVSKWFTVDTILKETPTSNKRATQCPLNIKQTRASKKRAMQRAWGSGGGEGTRLATGRCTTGDCALRIALAGTSANTWNA